jgi:hypothetical protein
MYYENEAPQRNLLLERAFLLLSGGSPVLSCTCVENIVFLYWRKLILFLFYFFVNLKLCHKFDRLEMRSAQKGIVANRFEC